MSSPLPKPLRTPLENTVKSARDVAEKAVYAALAQLAVAEAKAPGYLTDDLKALRRRLRAHGRALGDAKHQRCPTPHCCGRNCVCCTRALRRRRCWAACWTPRAA